MNYPSKVFSGKQSDLISSNHVFFCYAIPGIDNDSTEHDEPMWTMEAGITKWYLYNVEKDSIIEEPTSIIDIIRSDPETPRSLHLGKESLVEIRKKMDKHIKNTYLKSIQAPIGVKPKLMTWMEIC